MEQVHRRAMRQSIDNAVDTFRMVDAIAGRIGVHRNIVVKSIWQLEGRYGASDTSDLLSDDRLRTAFYDVLRESNATYVSDTL